MTADPPTVLCVAQAGRLEYEALIFVLSFRAANPGFAGRLVVAEPSGALWPEPVAISPRVRRALIGAGAEIRPFGNRVFGAAYPQGNKIEALCALPPGPFVFFDTDTLFTGPLPAIDVARPSASMRRTGTWPVPPLYGPGYGAIWRSLYRLFGLEFDSTLDLSQPDEHWERYLYFNAGWFFGADAPAFGARFLDWADRIRRAPPEELACQALSPWLDQIALPLVVHSFGGGRPGPELAGLDGDVSTHYRTLALLYARESDAAVEMLERIAAPREVRRILRDHPPAKELIYHNKGRKLRAGIDQTRLPAEADLRRMLKARGLWLR